MIKRYDALVDGSELDDEVWAYLSESEDGEAVLYTDYAALEAENAELRDLVGKKNESIEVLYVKWSKEIAKATAANATLDRMREVVPEILPPHMSWKDALDGARAILYPTPETPND